MDFGWQRSSTINAEGVSIPNKVTVKGITYPVLKRRGPVRLKKPSDFGRDTQAYEAHVKEEMARASVAVGARGQAITNFGKDKRLPMRKYYSHTGKGGRIGGNARYFPEQKQVGGAEWKALASYKYQVTQGDIEARNFTTGLFVMMRTGSDTFGMGKIWPRVRTFESWVRSGWYRGRKYYEQGSQSR